MAVTRAASVRRSVEVELAVANELALARRERRELDERQHRRQPFGAERLEGTVQGDVFAGEQRRRHEQLGLVGTACCLAGRDRRATEVDDAQLVAVDDQVPIIELAVGDAGSLQPVEDRPRPLDELGSVGPTRRPRRRRAPAPSVRARAGRRRRRPRPP